MVAVVQNPLQEITPDTKTLVYNALPDSSYHDAIEGQLTPGRFATIDNFCRQYFQAQPLWLSTVSMNVTSRAKLGQMIAGTHFQPGESIGSWKIYDRNKNEIVFGEQLGIMTYRFSLRLEHDAEVDRVIASTSARMNNTFGRFYFSLVRLIHKRFVRLTLWNAVTRGAQPPQT
jgi:hypothetical protein